MEGSWNATLRRSSGFQPEPAARQVENLHDEHRLKTCATGRRRSEGLPMPREPGYGSKRSQDGEAPRTCRERRAGCPPRTSGAGARAGPSGAPRGIMVQVGNLHLRGEPQVRRAGANVRRRGTGSPERCGRTQPLCYGRQGGRHRLPTCATRSGRGSRDGQLQAARASVRNASTSASVVAQEHMNRQPPAPMKL